MRERNRDRSRDQRSAPLLESLVTSAAQAAASGFTNQAAAGVDRVVARCERQPDGWSVLSQVLRQLLILAVGEQWRRGWQPADLAHVVGRQLRAVHRQVCAVAIEADAVTYRHAPGADPGWLAQVDAVTAVAPSEERADDLGFARPLGRTQPTPLLDQLVLLAGGIHDALLVVVETMGLFHRLPAQPRLCPPPSDWGSAPRPPTTGRAPDPKVTERVRALLAKAESTTFPDEAEAFTAKAQELIARHAIDLAMLGGAEPAGDVVGRRILIDDPYGRAKSVLVAVIAGANGSNAVFSAGLGICTVFGAPSDLDAIELLFASLLTQATAAMAAAGRSGGVRARRRSFRQSFLLSFAGRIGERLDLATAAAVDDARTVHGDKLLPVLASRAAASEQAREAAFPQLRGQWISMSSPEGWVAGRVAADLARLGPDGQLQAG